MPVEYLPAPQNDANPGKVVCYIFWARMIPCLLFEKVVIKYQSLVNGDDLSDSIEAAFGYDGYDSIHDIQKNVDTLTKTRSRVSITLNTLSLTTIH